MVWCCLDLLPGWHSSNLTTYISIEIIARNNDANADVPMTMENYINYVCTAPELRDPPRLYGKDVTCPKEWEQASAKLLPEYFVSKGPNDLLGGFNRAHLTHTRLLKP